MKTVLAILTIVLSLTYVKRVHDRVFERAHDNFIYGCLIATDDTGISVLPGFTEELDGETATTFQSEYCEGKWKEYFDYNKDRGVL